MLAMNILRMLQTQTADGTLRFELNKVLLFMGHLFGWTLTGYATIVQMPSHEVLFMTMIGASVGGIVSKGAMDTKQMQVRRDE